MVAHVVSDQIEYQRGPTDAGPGASSPLPQGGAAQLNEAVAQTPAPASPPEIPNPEDILPSEQDLAGIAGAQPQQEPPFSPGMGTTGLNPDDEKWLFAATEHPDQAPVPMRMIDPKDAAAWLPALRAEASRPDAPPQLKAIFKAMVLGPGA